jgi:regulator of sirC expression with transglutaminase-like and TPR domain
MPTTYPARARLRALLRTPEPRLDLAAAALCVAWEEQGVDRVDRSLGSLQAIADAARGWTVGQDSADGIVNALNRYMFGELGFHGNIREYNDPANSMLDQVLERRVGLPITLSIIYIEVGWRLGLPLSGVALPGHFLARYGQVEGAIYIDPFNRGRLWTQAECETQIATFYGESTPALVAQVMAPPSKRAILARLVRNLKNLYAERGELERALAASDRILLLEPGAAVDVRDRGLLRARLGLLHGALEDLDRYARLAPGAADLPQIRREARALAQRAAAGN